MLSKAEKSRFTMKINYEHLCTKWYSNQAYNAEITKMRIERDGNILVK